MLMVLHASQMSAEGVPTCSRARSTRLPKAVEDGELSGAAVLIAALLENGLVVHDKAPHAIKVLSIAFFSERYAIECEKMRVNSSHGRYSYALANAKNM